MEYFFCRFCHHLLGGMRECHDWKSTKDYYSHLSLRCCCGSPSLGQFLALRTPSNACNSTCCIHCLNDIFWQRANTLTSSRSVLDRGRCFTCLTREVWDPGTTLHPTGKPYRPSPWTTGQQQLEGLREWRSPTQPNSPTEPCRGTATARILACWKLQAPRPRRMLEARAGFSLLFDFSAGQRYVLCADARQHMPSHAQKCPHRSVPGVCSDWHGMRRMRLIEALSASLLADLHKAPVEIQAAADAVRLP